MSLQEHARHLRQMVFKAASSLSDEDALEAVELFPRYAVGVDYKRDDRILWDENGKLYKVLLNHTSSKEWTPDTAVSLYVEVTPPGVIPVWRQPQSAVDAYMIGDKVRYPDEEGSVWESTVDNNVWEPGVYGWNEIG